MENKSHKIELAKEFAKELKAIEFIIINFRGF